MTFISYYETRKISLEEKHNIVSLEVVAHSTYLERQFSIVYENAQLFSLTVEQIANTPGLSDNRDFLLAISESILEENQNIIGVNVILEPNVIGNDADYIGDDRFQFDGQFTSYISKQNGVLNVEYLENYDDYEFYYNTERDLKSNFSEPYYFNIEGETEFITTVSFPISLNGNFLGVVGLDISANYILEKLDDLTFTYDTRFIVVSQDGIILLNSLNPETSSNHISTIHPYYFNGIAAVNLNGIKEGIMDTGNYEVIYGIELAGTGDMWYAFCDVDTNLLMQDVYKVAYETFLFGFALLLVFMVILYFVDYSITSPITALTKAVQNSSKEDFDVSNLDINTKKLNDIQLLKDSFVSVFQTINTNMVLSEKQAYMQEMEINLRNFIDQSTSIEDYYNRIIEKITNDTQGIMGVLFLNENNTLRVQSQYGTSISSDISYKLGQGLIGKVAQKQEMIILDQLDQIEPAIDFGINKMNPKYIIIIPICSKNKTIAVIEIVAMQAFDDEVLEYLEHAIVIIYNNMIRKQAIEQTRVLYEQSTKLATELKQQQEELEIKNEELTSQQEELRVTNEELESQQEELRVANNELQNNLEKTEKINLELENAQIELDEKRREAELSNKYKGEFLANMSHELRTPLNSILILSDLISENKQANSKIKDFSKTINSAGNELLELINGILDLSKVESGKDEVINEEWIVNDDLAEIKQKFSALAKQKNIELIINNPKTTIALNTDRKKVKLILSNLLSNAIKFTKTGSVSLEIIDEGDIIAFNVIDTGIGIKEPDTAMIFDEFKQLDSTDNRSYKGTGLGLSLCQNYANILNGTLSVVSKYGKGSTFSLKIPKIVSQELKIKRRVVNEQQRIDKQDSLTDDRNEVSQNQPSMLIIDDDIDFLKSVQGFFKAHNINVIVSNTGENGLFLADYYLPKCILIDIKLKTMDGIIVYDKLMANERTASIPKYIISGGVSKNQIKGIPIYKKPLSTDLLKSIANDIIEKTKRDKINNILLVEDDLNQQKAIKEYINANKNIDFNIVTATTKLDTLKLLDKTEFIMLVVDLSLSDAHNFELIEAIREKDEYKNIPIIVYTGKVFDINDEKVLSKMVQDIIIKGIESPQRLLDDIKLFLNSSSGQQFASDKKIFKGKTVLVVDDDIRNIFALSGLLEIYDIKYVYDTSGIEGIKRLRNDKTIDLVLLDIMMPEIDGYETMNIIRNELKLRDLPIIALTAKTMKGDREKCINAGATEYLAKPLDKNKLLSVLRVWLQ